MRSILSASVALLLVFTIRTQNFSEVALSAGINVTYGIGIHGGGVSFADFSGDGIDDLTFTSASGQPVYFYRNNGNGTFTSLNLINNFEESKEAIWVDYDNDGDQDLFLTIYNGVNRLFRNEGGLNMTDVTTSAFGNLGPSRNFGAAWGDYDRDGWLDLYVCEYKHTGTKPNALYRNNGNGTFTEVGSGSPANDGVRLSFDACFFDSNNDEWPEIYVINDRYDFSNGLYENQLGSYSTSPTSGANISLDAMNAGGADYDNDGDFDLYVANTNLGNQLLRNDGTGNFTDVATATGTGVFQFSWASSFFDYDNDLDQDLYVSCLDNNMAGEANAFLVNESDGTFSSNLAATGGLGGNDTGQSYGNAIGDFNNDGRLDIAVSQESNNNLLWRNDETATGNFLRLRLTGTTSNRDGIGARVVAQVGNQLLTRWRQGSQGYLSQHSQSLHFGLGGNSQVTQLTVYWPSGIVDIYDNVTSINQLMGLTEGETVLPLVLTDFRAKTDGAHNLLNWISSQESNTSHFEIERSDDGNRFSKIGLVLAGGNSQAELNYEFLDRKAGAPEVYYRLKMVDLDGSFTYSEVRRVSRTGTAAEKMFRLGANPAINTAINVISEEGIRAGNYQLRLYNAGGSVVRQGSVVSDGNSAITHTFSPGLSSGSYWLEISGNGHFEHHRLIVK